MKKPFYIIALAAVCLIIIAVSAFFAFFYQRQDTASNFGRNNQNPVNETSEAVWFAYEDGESDPEIYKNFEADLLELFFDYRDAMILTQASLHLDYENTTQEDFNSLSNQVIIKWEEVEADVAKVTSYSQNPKTAWVWDWYRAKSKSRRPLVPAVHAAFEDEMTGEQSIRYHGWHEFHALQNMMPGADEEFLIEQSFGGTAQEVKRRYIEYQSQVAENWGDWVSIHNIASKTAKGIELSSKVALFIGGTIISGGTLGLAAPATAAGGTLMVVSGADLICDLGQGSAALGFADPKTGDTFAAIQEKMGPLTFIANVADVTSYAENPGGTISAVSGLAKTTVEALSFDVENGGMYIAPKQPDDVRFPTINSDGIVENYFPPGYNYDVTPGEIKRIEEQAAAEKETQEQAETAATAHIGTYEGKMTVSLPSAYGTTKIDIPVRLVIGHELVKMTFDSAGNLPFNMAGAGGGVTVDYKYNGELTGNLNEDKESFNINGSFNSTGKINVPAITAQHMPPDALAQLNIVNNGTASAYGTIYVADNEVIGDVQFTGSQMTASASYNAKRLQVYTE